MVQIFVFISAIIQSQQNVSYINPNKLKLNNTHGTLTQKREERKALSFILPSEIEDEETDKLSPLPNIRGSPTPTFNRKFSFTRNSNETTDVKPHLRQSCVSSKEHSDFKNVDKKNKNLLVIIFVLIATFLLLLGTLSFTLIYFLMKKLQ